MCLYTCIEHQSYQARKGKAPTDINNDHMHTSYNVIDDIATSQVDKEHSDIYGDK